jgi:hypothetical protein
VFIVALMELAGDLAVETAAIASMLGLSAYDVRSRLMGGLPRVLFQSASAEEATRVEKGLLGRGHGVYVCDDRQIVPHDRMVKLGRFSFDAAGLWAHDRGGEPLAWRDLGVVVLVAVRSKVRRMTRVRGANPRAIPRVEEDRVGDDEVITHAAYLFGRAAATRPRPPWLLEEETAQYISLGDRMQPTRHQNFITTVNRFRDLAPEAVFHDRLVSRPQPVDNFVQVHGHPSGSPSTAVASLDLTVQILARWMMRDRGGPYRG